MTMTGIFVGNDPLALQSFNDWLGTDADIVGAHTGRANWTDWQTSISWEASLWKGSGANIEWTIPMFANGGNLASAAAGAYNNYYLTAAQTLLDVSSGTGKIIVRVGEEFNGNWMPWAAAGQEQNYINAYRDFVDVFRSVSDRFEFVWCTSVGGNGMNPEAAYPGDQYVDVIATDFYYNQWQSSDPATAWNNMVKQPYGLQWLEDFAAAHGKPTAYSEWGVQYDNAGAFIDGAAKWFAAHNPLYQIYWDSNIDSSLPTELSQHPATAAAYLKDFGATSSSLVTLYFEGTNGNDYLAGSSGNNILNGRLGADTLVGGAGNDTYFMNNSATKVVELANGGVDTIISSTSFTLPDYVEKLTAASTTTWSRLTGNSLGNIITGNAGVNIINGGWGNDTLTGGGGNDKFVFAKNSGYDTITDFSGTQAGLGTQDTLVLWGYDSSAYLTHLGDVWTVHYNGGTDSFHLIGVTSLDGQDYRFVTDIGATPSDGQFIRGNDGDNILRSPVGPDSIYGLGGNDTIYGGDGNDTIYGGDANDALYGQNGNDILYGEAGDDVLYGGAGDDKLYGQDGNDTLFAGGAGSSRLDGGAGDDKLFGNVGADTLYGGLGNDMLRGGGGNDVLYGGSGKDTFMFASPTQNGFDTIADFEVGVDRLAFKASDYGLPTGALAASHFEVGAAATGLGSEFVYNATTHVLSWDPDGAGSQAAVKLAVFSNSALLHASDFLIV